MTDEAGRSAVIIVDVQNDFCEGGSMGVDGGGSVAAAITELVGDDRGGGRYDYVVATRDWHIDPGAHWADEPDFVATWPRHCAAGTDGAAFHEALRVPTDEVFSKGQHSASYSGFEGAADSDGSALADWLHARGVDRVTIVGIATDHCVRATALDAAANGFATQVLLDLCAGVAPDTTTAAIGEMRTSGIALV